MLETKFIARKGAVEIAAPTMEALAKAARDHDEKMMKAAVSLPEGWMLVEKSG